MFDIWPSTTVDKKMVVLTTSGDPNPSTNPNGRISELTKFGDQYLKHSSFIEYHLLICCRHTHVLLFDTKPTAIGTSGEEMRPSA